MFRNIRLMALAILVILPGCAQGRGDWPTLASALGWGSSDEPSPPTYTELREIEPASRPQPDLTRPSQYAPPATATHTLTTMAAAPRPTIAAPPPPPTAYRGGDDLVAQAFSEGLAATAPTMSVTSNMTSFAPPSAQTLPSDLSGVVPRVVLETYNDALVDTFGSGMEPVEQVVIGGDVQSTGNYTVLDPTVIKFRKGSSRLSDRDKRRIRKLVRNYKSNGGIVSVIGHASSRTGDMKQAKHNLINFEISLDRANAVTGELLRQGVAPQDLISEARADRDPIYYEYMPSGEAGNQRVEIFLQ